MGPERRPRFPGDVDVHGLGGPGCKVANVGVQRPPPPPGNDPQGLRELLVPAAPGRLEAYPVSTEVNSVRNNGPQLVEPIPLDTEDGLPEGLPEGPGHAEDTP